MSTDSAGRPSTAFPPALEVPMPAERTPPPDAAQAELTLEIPHVTSSPTPEAGAEAGDDNESPLGPTGRPLPEFPEPPALTSHGPVRVVAMCNQKGGVGKTTTAINLGAALAECGRRVLLVDFDPQGALSVGLGIQGPALDRTIYNVLMERDCAVEDVLLETEVPGLDLVPANIDLSAAEVQLVGEVAREQVLARALAPVLADRY